MRDPLLIEVPTRIDGERVSLRAYRAEDAATIDEAARASQRELAAVFPWAASLPSVEERSVGLRRRLACFVLRTELAYEIWRLGDGRYLGDTGLFGPDWNVRRFEIGYWLRTDESGKGYATEAARLLVDLAFGLLGARRVFVRCDAANRRSAGVPLRLGFEHEGTLRNEALRPNGEPADVMVFGMTPERWPSTPFATAF